MLKLDRIMAIKQLRNEWRDARGYGLGLAEAKTIVDLIAPFIIDVDDQARALEVQHARMRVDETQHNMQELLRMVAYFVAHPGEYEAWMNGHGIAPHATTGEGE